MTDLESVAVKHSRGGQRDGEEPSRMTKLFRAISVLADRAAENDTLDGWATDLNALADEARQAAIHDAQRAIAHDVEVTYGEELERTLSKRERDHALEIYQLKSENAASEAKRRVWILLTMFAAVLGYVLGVVAT